MEWARKRGKGLLLLLLLSLVLTGCVGGKQSTPSISTAEEAPVDSLKAKFAITLFTQDGKSQDLDAVLFSVPNKRYRMELTGALGVGVASLLWLEEGWQMVFPTEKMYMKGAGYMVGLFNDPSLPLVHIHQVAALFDGHVLPAKFEVQSTHDSLAMKFYDIRDAAGRYYTYAEKNGEVVWLESQGRDGLKEKLVVQEYKEFNGIKTPSKIAFVRDGTIFLEIHVKKIHRGKSFGSGTWRLNIPRSYTRMGGTVSNF